VSLVADLISREHTDVEADGRLWRLRRVDSAALASAGVAMLLMLPSAAEGELPSPAQALRRASPEASARTAAKMDELLCAGIAASSDDDGETWEPVRFVLRRQEQDVEADPPRLHVSLLPGPARNPLISAIMAQATEGGRAVERVAAFRGEPGDASDA